jgi:hypothetical protein
MKSESRWGKAIPHALLAAALAAALGGCRLLGLGTPVPPTRLTVGTVTISSIDLSWDKVTGAKSYQVFRDTNAAGGFATTVFDGAATSITDYPNAVPFAPTQYFYKVQATNASGTSRLSPAVSATTHMPGILTVKNTTGSFANLPIYFVYISPTSSTTWGSDWLGASIIAVGGAADFYLDADTYDLKAVDSAQNVYTSSTLVVAAGDHWTWTLTAHD